MRNFKILGAFAITLASAASVWAACAECPFPMSNAQGRWIMIDRPFEVEIIPNRVIGRTTDVSVRILMSGSQELIASGRSLHSNSAHGTRDRADHRGDLRLVHRL